MSTIMAPAGLVNISAPVPEPPRYDLLATATLVDPANDRWLGGAWIRGDAPGPAYTHDPCSTGTERVKAEAGEIPKPVTGRFIVYLPAFCTASSIGPDPTYFTDRLEQIFQVYEGAAVERVLAMGDGHSTLGPYLGDGNVEILTGGAVTALRGLELLETEIARNGTGIIHAAPATATAWAADSLIETSGAIKRTVAKGTPVAIGGGYIGVHPASESAPAADQEWAFASGPIQIYRDLRISTFPGNYAEALNRAMNDVMFYAERPYLFNWVARQDPSDDDHIQAAVLIDLVP